MMRDLVCNCRICTGRFPFNGWTVAALILVPLTMLILDILVVKGLTP